MVRFELYEGRRLVYAIFFATHSTKGSDRMKEAIWKAIPFGDFGFRGSRSSQLGLDLQATDFRPLQDALRAEFGDGGWVDIEAVENFVASDSTDFYTGQLRKHALIPMEDAGNLEVNPATRNRPRTYPSGSKLRFKAP